MINYNKKAPQLARSDNNYQGLVSPNIVPQAIVSQIMKENGGNVGGTIRDGSQDEIFIIGAMIFHVEPAKAMAEGNSNCAVKCSNSWSEKINVEEDHAIKSSSENPVLIAQIPLEHGKCAYLLFDGHHRMYKAISEGRNEVPGYMFTPEETLVLMSAPPDLMYKLRNNLKTHRGANLASRPIPMTSDHREAMAMPDTDRFQQIAKALSTKKY